MHDEAWWERGLCRGIKNPWIFESPEQRGPRARWRGDQWQEAKKMCRHCPVKQQCLEFVLDQPASEWQRGLFAAGLTPRQLQEIRERRARR